VSDAPGLPRLLANLLGVEVPGATGAAAPPPQGPPRQVGLQPPAPAPGTKPASRLTPPERLKPEPRGARVPARGTAGRPPAASQAVPASTSPVRRPRPVHAGTGSAYVLPAAGDAAMTREALRQVLRSPAHARTAVLAAEVLGAPRALRPYSAD
jgi:hypothetical protein